MPAKRLYDEGFKLLKVPFEPDEYGRIYELADAEGLSMAQFVRKAVQGVLGVSNGHAGHSERGIPERRAKRVRSNNASSGDGVIEERAVIADGDTGVALTGFDVGKAKFCPHGQLKTKLCLQCMGME